MHVYFRCVTISLSVCTQFGLQSLYIFRGRVVGPFRVMVQYPVPSDPSIRLPRWVGQCAPPYFMTQHIIYSAELMMFFMDLPLPVSKGDRNRRCRRVEHMAIQLTEYLNWASNYGQCPAHGPLWNQIYGRIQVARIWINLTYQQD